LSISFHPDLRELFGQVDGLKRLRGHRRDPRLPGFNFPSLKEATDRTLRLRDVAETVDSIELWRQHWVKVFAVDCSDGSVWYAWWEASEIHQVAPDLATLFDMAAAAADGDDVHYRLDGDYFETPDVFDAIAGLPVHPLVVHFAVVLLPLAALGLIVLVIVPSWADRFGLESSYQAPVEPDLSFPSRGGGLGRL
jgi:hypothetical protein